mmetsp:Transcript_38043/g.63950  ORF Transcript_38043/g.63950 Transcript_38043/m.63950 type:complete len:92 (+) Transcript_38043:161-436(+)|eukprot:CAMPEP_0198228840 /NCGR_PEP_ID=MMETSP1445-20131203/113812_1 /TAXON_ID=36898 /ORGANISM="Pyramimonas sp., Strain CCMP2087" /LENGTH=91 /DNA_ID=CAMNT_0043909271 /DNA_START=161 /DNA_END=436 /DNA_ORIENTATION=-
MAKKGPAKHSAKDLKARDDATKAKNGGVGGGGAGDAARKAKTTKCLIKCAICLGMQPNVHSMGIHYEAKHAKVKWDDAMKASYEALAAGGE